MKDPIWRKDMISNRRIIIKTNGQTLNLNLNTYNIWSMEKVLEEVEYLTSIPRDYMNLERNFSFDRE
jgi:hypothetical protein